MNWSSRRLTILLTLASTLLGLLLLAGMLTGGAGGGRAAGGGWLESWRDGFGGRAAYRVAFEDANGIEPGAVVLLAGRAVGRVARVVTPLPLEDRPRGHPDYEALVEVRVDPAAAIYRQSTPLMRLLPGDKALAIDFVRGNPVSGLADRDGLFVGVTALPPLAAAGGGPAAGPGLAAAGGLTARGGSPVAAAPEAAGGLGELDPTLREAQRLIGSLNAAVENLNRLIDQDSAFAGVLVNLEGVVANLKTVSGAGGPVDNSLRELQVTLQNVHQITDEFSRGGKLERMLDNFTATSNRLRDVTNKTDVALGRTLPEVEGMAGDLKQLTGKLKEQPWRVLWPSTIKYPPESAAPAAAARAPRPAQRARARTRSAGETAGSF